MTESQKRVLLIAGVGILALIIWLMGKKGNATTVQTPQGPVTFGDVQIPGIDFPPRDTGPITIPGFNPKGVFGYGASTCMCSGQGVSSSFLSPANNVITIPSQPAVYASGAPAHGDFTGVVSSVRIVG